MATRQELLQELSSTSVESYKSIIEISKTTATKKRLEYTKIGDFMQRRYQRLLAIDNTYEEKNSDLSKNYAIFQGISDTLGGRGATDLDQVNYTINGTMYGDIKKTSARKRQLKDMAIKLTLIGDTMTNLENIERDLDTLKNELDALS